MKHECGWCASNQMTDRGTVASSERHLQEWMTLCTKSCTPISIGCDYYKNLGVCNGLPSIVDADHHIRLAMDSHNPLHTTASHRNLGPVFLGIDWALFSLSTIMVLLRLYTRLWITRNFGWDDATIALTQASHLSFPQKSMQRAELPQCR